MLFVKTLKKAALGANNLSGSEAKRKTFLPHQKIFVPLRL